MRMSDRAKDIIRQHVSALDYLTTEGKKSKQQAIDLGLYQYYDIHNGTYCVPLADITPAVQKALDVLYSRGYSSECINEDGEIDENGDALQIYDKDEWR